MYVYIYILFFFPKVFTKCGVLQGNWHESQAKLSKCLWECSKTSQNIILNHGKTALPGAAVLFLEPWFFLGYPDITTETHDEHLQISSNLAVTPNNFGNPMDKSQANWPFRIAMVASPSLLLLFFIFILHFHRRHRHGHHHYCHYDLCYHLFSSRFRHHHRHQNFNRDVG